MAVAASKAPASKRLVFMAKSLPVPLISRGRCHD